MGQRSLALPEVVRGGQVEQLYHIYYHSHICHHLAPVPSNLSGLVSVTPSTSLNNDGSNRLDGHHWNTFAQRTSLESAIQSQSLPSLHVQHQS
jgi:hypothetical protein